MKNNHEFSVPEHHVIRAMELYGEYPVPDRRRWGKDNPSVSFADSSLCTREPLGAVGETGFGPMWASAPTGTVEIWNRRRSRHHNSEF